MWKLLFPPKTYLQECNYSNTLSVHFFPWDPEHTDPHSSQIEGNSCHFQVSKQRYLSQTWQDSLFVSWVCLLSDCWGSFRLLESSFPVSAEATQRIFHLWRRCNNYTTQRIVRLLCPPEKYVENPKLRISCWWSTSVLTVRAHFSWNFLKSTTASAWYPPILLLIVIVYNRLYWSCKYIRCVY